PAIHRRIAGGWRYVMVDEYQDTNLVQAELTKLLSSVHGNVMAVGDDAQSIYAFRGANYRNILDFPQAYPGCKIIKLEENYRSTQRILDVTNFIINQAQEKFSKHLYTRREPAGEFPALVTAPDENMQSAFVAQRILELREEGVPLHEIAVLMRNGRNSFDLEIELQRRKIPFVKYGGQKLVEAAHIRDFLSYLKVLHNPKDLVSWNRILLLLEGVGPRTARGVTDWIKDAEEPYSLERATASRKYVLALRELGELLGRLARPEISLSNITEAVLAYYLPLLRRHYFEDHPRREADLENFLTIISSSDSVESLLSELALDPVDQAATYERLENDEKPLVLSTIHSAKGLEWHAVFLINALDGIIPSSYALGNSTELDEELRLLYVALTRAQNLLYMCYPSLASRRGYDYYLTNPSRFLKELPGEIYERLLLVEEPAVNLALNEPA
ncbi:MAG: ATP-dependent helicase, partial [Abitibacteriaceae bacterium]|nr:ATP-dependent helicase [Abditibacteriaceae bacterium]